MREYELTVIIQPEISEEGTAALFERLEGVLASHGAIRLLNDDLGKRKLAFEINKFNKGHYFILYFLDEGKSIPELERILRMDESVLRFMTILANEQVEDIEARRADAKEREVELAKRAAERAAREAEEAKARAEAEERAAAEAAVAAEAAAKLAAEEAKAAEAAGDDDAAEASDDEDESQKLAPAAAASEDGAAAATAEAEGEAQ